MLPPELCKRLVQSSEKGANLVLVHSNGSSRSEVCMWILVRVRTPVVKGVRSDCNLFARDNNPVHRNEVKWEGNERVEEDSRGSQTLFLI